MGRKGLGLPVASWLVATLVLCSVVGLGCSSSVDREVTSMLWDCLNCPGASHGPCRDLNDPYALCVEATSDGTCPAGTEACQPCSNCAGASSGPCTHDSSDDSTCFDFISGTCLCPAGSHPCPSIAGRNTSAPTPAAGSSASIGLHEPVCSRCASGSGECRDADSHCTPRVEVGGNLECPAGMSVCLECDACAGDSAGECRNTLGVCWKYYTGTTVCPAGTTACVQGVSAGGHGDEVLPLLLVDVTLGGIDIGEFKGDAFADQLTSATPGVDSSHVSIQSITEGSEPSVPKHGGRRLEDKVVYVGAVVVVPENEDADSVTNVITNYVTSGSLSVGMSSQLGHSVQAKLSQPVGDTTSSRGEDSDSALPVHMVGAVTVGIVLLIVLIAIVVVYQVRRNNERRRAKPAVDVHTTATRSSSGTSHRSSSPFAKKAPSRVDVSPPSQRRDDADKPFKASRAGSPLSFTNSSVVLSPGSFMASPSDDSATSRFKVVGGGLQSPSTIHNPRSPLQPTVILPHTPTSSVGANRDDSASSSGPSSPTLNDAGSRGVGLNDAGSPPLKLVDCSAPKGHSSSWWSTSGAQRGWGSFDLTVSSPTVEGLSSSTPSNSASDHPTGRPRRQGASWSHSREPSPTDEGDSGRSGSFSDGSCSDDSFHGRCKSSCSDGDSFEHLESGSAVSDSRGDSTMRTVGGDSSTRNSGGDAGGGDAGGGDAGGGDAGGCLREESSSALERFRKSLSDRQMEREVPKASSLRQASRTITVDTDTEDVTYVRVHSPVTAAYAAHGPAVPRTGRHGSSPLARGHTRSLSRGPPGASPRASPEFHRPKTFTFTGTPTILRAYSESFGTPSAPSPLRGSP